MPEVDLDRVLKKYKLSRRQFAIRLKKDPKNTPRMFKKGFNPRFKDMVKYAKVIGCKIRELIKE